MTFTPEQNPRIQLNSGQQIPQLGLGVYKVGQDIGVELVKAAIEVGYRRIDTAALYDNEFEIGAGVRQSGLDREQLFVTTKIWNDRQGFDNATEAIDEALARLNIEYIDMLLIHWPCPQKDLFVETWQAFQDAQANGKIRGIGVSNFKPAHLDKLLAAGGTVPAINQVEMHPWLQQAELRAIDIRSARIDLHSDARVLLRIGKNRDSRFACKSSLEGQPVAAFGCQGIHVGERQASRTVDSCFGQRGAYRAWIVGIA